MDHSLFALSRVDELERRVAGLSQNQTQSQDFEVFRTAVGEYVCGNSKTIELCSFVPKVGDRSTIVVSVWGEFLFETQVKVNLCCSNETVFEMERKEQDKFFWTFSKSVKAFDAQAISLSLKVAGDDMRFVLDGFLVQVFGGVEQSPKESMGAMLCADLFDKNQTDPQDCAQDQSADTAGASVTESSHIISNILVSAFKSSAATAAEIAEHHRIINGEVDPLALVAPTVAEPQTPQSEESTQSSQLVVGEGQKLAISKVANGQLFLAEFGENQTIEPNKFEFVSNANAAAVAYDKFGDLYVAKLVSGKLFLRNHTKRWAWAELADGVLGFDVVSAPAKARAGLLVAYTTSTGTQIVELEHDKIRQNWTMSTQKPTKYVNFARGNDKNRLILLQQNDGSTWLQELLVEPRESASSTKSLRLGASISAY